MTITRYIPASAATELLMRVYAKDRPGDHLRPRLLLTAKDAAEVDPNGKAAKVTMQIEGVD